MQCGCRLQPCLAKPFAGSSVKQDRVFVRFPNRCVFHAAWAVQAEIHATRFAASQQNPLRHGKDTGFKLFVIAKGYVNEFSQLFYVLKTIVLCQHQVWGLLVVHGFIKKKATEVKWEVHSDFLY